MSKFKPTLSMMQALDPLGLKVPRNATGLMQQLQLLVGREDHRLWCGGVVPPNKLEGFVEKMASRYPILRNARQRAYDRRRGLAVLHFVAFPVAEDVAWWLLSGTGKGGLSDPSAPDAHVARDAMDAKHHVAFGDYVLLYANKKTSIKVVDRKTGKEKTREKQVSTWTWKLRKQVVNELACSIEAECEALQFGSDDADGWGLRGLLARQRRRPLFSGVRNQVIDLHRFANDAWARRRSAWRSKHPHMVEQYGELAGALVPVKEVIAKRLPTMSRMKVYGDDPMCVRDLLPGQREQAPAELRGTAD